MVRSMSENYSVAVLGGGTGTRAVLSGLREHPVDLTAIINMSDNGGSSGILREQLGVAPPGDIRQAIAALSRAPDCEVEYFEHRYQEGEAPRERVGHPMGNLLLAHTAAQFGCLEAVRRVSALYDVAGKVLPVTEELHDLYADVDGRVISGEYDVGQALMYQRPRLWLAPQPTVHEDARAAIQTADMVVIAPGDLYGSLAPTLLVGGVAQAIAERRGPLVYVANLLNKSNQTAGFRVGDYVSEIKRFAGSEVDTVIQNTGEVDTEWLACHAQPGEQIVHPEEHLSGVELVGLDMVDRTLNPDRSKSTVTKSFVRHDGSKVASALMELVDV